MCEKILGEVKRHHGLESSYNKVLKTYTYFSYKGYTISNIEKWEDQEEDYPIKMFFDVFYKGEKIVSGYHSTSETKKDLIDFCKYAIDHNDHFLTKD